LVSVFGDESDSSSGMYKAGASKFFDGERVGESILLRSVTRNYLTNCETFSGTSCIGQYNFVAESGSDEFLPVILSAPSVAHATCMTRQVLE